MLSFAEAADSIARTSRKLEKIALVAEYFKSVPLEEAVAAAVFFSGRPFPAWEETTLQVGGRLLWQVVGEISGKDDHELAAAYRKYGDLGDVAGALLPDKSERDEGRPQIDGARHNTPRKIQQTFREIAARRGPAAKAVLLRELLSETSPVEAKYLVKIMTGDLRIGLKESLVEEAIAKACGATLKEAQRANMLLGDIGETLRLAAENRLEEARMRLFHPLGFMLASPARSTEDALSYFESAWVEDKYDGIRAQAHCSGNTVRLFSRTRDEITASFPELAEALRGLPQDAILDGEILAWSYLAEDVEENGELKPINVEPRASTPALPAGRALAFSALQQRLGRKKVSEKLMRDVPVAYLAFDVLYARSELVIDRPFDERAAILEKLLAAERKPVHERDTAAEQTAGMVPDSQTSLAFESLEPTGGPPLLASPEKRMGAWSSGRSAASRPTTPIVMRAPAFRASSPEDLSKLFDAAQARGNEGLMIKDPRSPYTPGRRGKSWLKLKRELATLDVVVTAVEYGHGKRIGVLSDYTFAVRGHDQLLNIGKAYSGLTDAEILEMTQWFLEHTIEDQGFRLVVEPKIVLEIAFNNIMKSDRHSSGYALRFPRIVRLRPDKLPEEADTMERVREIYQMSPLEPRA
ncbi:MAG: ATP-dependent DNA ligase [Acidobacteria bacterium]|nr:ATP-dependent DNA ligase [Acidobacteriota bacterium]